MNTSSRYPSFLAVLIFAVLICAVLPSVAGAIPKASNYMVSPPSCMPIDADSADKLKLVNGAWTFRAGDTGQAELACPINFSGYAGNWDMIQLWFRDQFSASGSPQNGYVQAVFKKRLRNAPGDEEIESLGSGGSDEYGFSFLTSLPPGPNNFEVYFLEVVLYRASSTAEVAFTGFEIRF